MPKEDTFVQLNQSIKLEYTIDALPKAKVAWFLNNKELSIKTGCSLSAMNQIVKKGEGAYYSSGSRPNQTAKSWGLARLASALTSGKAAAIDYDIINKGCNHNKTAFILANKSRNKYGYGNSKTKKVMVKI